MAIVDVTFQDDFRRVRDGDTINLWNDIDIVEPFPPIIAEGVTLNGRGHILRGLTRPLFDNAPGDIETVEPTVNNLTVCVEFNRDDPTDGSNWGGLFRAARLAKITNCSVMVKIHSAYDYIGGIAGMLFDSVVERCAVRGILEGEYNVGGVAGVIARTSIIQCHNEATVTARVLNAGGIAAQAFAGSVIKECANFKKAVVTAMYDAGGIAGEIIGDVDIQCCRNRADIVSEQMTGGIIGYADGAFGTLTIIRNLNSGDINGLQIMGGVLGYLHDRGFVADNSNCGAVRGDMWFIGGVAGMVDADGNDAQLKNNRIRCGSIAGVSYVHRVVGLGSLGLLMTGNMADPEIRLTGDNPFDSQTYAGETVHDDDPQLGSHLLQGMSCRLQCPTGACLD